MFCILCSARRNAAAAAVVAIDDDDCMSMTSREVAAILSTAGPMAPPSDDDDNYTEYNDDDVSELEEHGSVSSSVQLLRISSSSSSNSSSGTPTAASTPTQRRANQLTPFYRQSEQAQLNNSSSNHRVEKFRPNMNGVCDRRCMVDTVQMNGGARTPVYSVGASAAPAQRAALFDLLRTHHVFCSTLELRLNNGHHVLQPPFQVSSREVITSLTRSTLLLCYIYRIDLLQPLISMPWVTFFSLKTALCSIT